MFTCISALAFKRDKMEVYHECVTCYVISGDFNSEAIATGFSLTPDDMRQKGAVTIKVTADRYIHILSGAMDVVPRMKIVLPISRCRQSKNLLYKIAALKSIQKMHRAYASCIFMYLLRTGANSKIEASGTVNR